MIIYKDFYSESEDGLTYGPKLVYNQPEFKDLIDNTINVGMAELRDLISDYMYDGRLFKATSHPLSNELYTLSEMAEKLEVSPSLFTHILKGERAFNPTSTVIACYDLAETSCHQLFWGTKPTIPLTQKPDFVASVLGALPPNFQASAVRALCKKYDYEHAMDWYDYRDYRINMVERLTDLAEMAGVDLSNLNVANVFGFNINQSCIRVNKRWSLVYMFSTNRAKPTMHSFFLTCVAYNLPLDYLLVRDYTPYATLAYYRRDSEDKNKVELIEEDDETMIQAISLYLRLPRDKQIQLVEDVHMLAYFYQFGNEDELRRYIRKLSSGKI